MADLLTVALAGTAASGDALVESGTPVEALLPIAAAGAGADAERRLLLAAGAAAVYRLAGYVAAAADEPPVPAPDESLPACSPAAALLLRLVVVGPHEDLLPEALDRLRRADLRLPFELLPLALGRREPELRAALLPVLGARGRWLSGFNRAWAWAAETPAGETAHVPADAETIWQEGSAGQRIALLRRLRAVDPERGRRWATAAWKQEKADFRQDMLRALAVALSADDEPLIEAALDDRAAAVRTEAAELLARLPGSAYASRMAARAETLLVYTDGKLDVRLPKTLPADAVRDGIAAKPPSGTGERAWWLEQILARVPLAHWTTRFDSPPDALIAAAAGSSWRHVLLDGWTRAAARFAARDWAAALWNAWREAPAKGRRTAALEDDELRASIARLLPYEMVAGAVANALEQAVTDDDTALDEELEPLPIPWTTEIGKAYLRGLYACCKRLTKTSRQVVAYAETLDRAAHALPQACFAAALEPVDLPDDNPHWAIRQLRQQLDEMSETIRLRARLSEAIPIANT